MKDYSRETKVYRANLRHELGLFQTWVVMFGNVIAAKELIYQLFKRDFFAAYKKIVSGYYLGIHRPSRRHYKLGLFTDDGSLKPRRCRHPVPGICPDRNLHVGSIYGFL